MAIEKELLDQLLAGRDPNEVFARDGLLDDLKKALSERILNAELDEHLDEERTEGGANRNRPRCTEFLTVPATCARQRRPDLIPDCDGQFWTPQQIDPRLAQNYC